MFVNTHQLDSGNKVQRGGKWSVPSYSSQWQKVKRRRFGLQMAKEIENIDSHFPAFLHHSGKTISCSCLQSSHQRDGFIWAISYLIRQESWLPQRPQTFDTLLTVSPSSKPQKPAHDWKLRNLSVSSLLLSLAVTSGFEDSAFQTSACIYLIMEMYAEVQLEKKS